jgi:hypothetical protein
MSRPKDRGSLLQRFRNLIRRLRRKSPPPADPFADRLAPVRRGPKGRSGAAVAEPKEDFYNVYRPRTL